MMIQENINSLVSEIMNLFDSQQKADKAVFQNLMDILADRWNNKPFPNNLLSRFKEKPAVYKVAFEDVLKEELAKDTELGDILSAAMSGKKSVKAESAKIPELTSEEIKVLKVLEQIGGGSPIDIAVEGMLDIEQTRKTAERLWHKGLLLSHPLKDPDAKRFFTFSELNRDVYKKLLEGSNDSHTDS